VNGAHPQGPFFLGPTISFVDVQVAPWFLRMRRVLKPYRGWSEPVEGSRLASWVEALEDNEAVKATTSGDELYLDSYERYAGKHYCCSNVYHVSFPPEHSLLIYDLLIFFPCTSHLSSLLQHPFSLSIPVSVISPLLYPYPSVSHPIQPKRKRKRKRKKSANVNTPTYLRFHDAENRPNTSQVANAINAGRPLP
jgi:hypothetical protein